MDVEANLREQAELAGAIIAEIDSVGGASGINDEGLSTEALNKIAIDAERLAELVQAFIGWRKAGGFT
jgi:hypothetical protein